MTEESPGMGERITVVVHRFHWCTAVFREWLLAQARSSDVVCVVLGATQSSPSGREPFTLAVRQQLRDICVRDLPGRVVLLELPDLLYQSQAWGRMLVSELAQRLRYLPEATAKGAKAESDDACDAADVGTNVGTDICTDVATGGNVDEVSVTERQRPTKWQAPEVQPARSWTFWFHHPDPELTPCLPGPLAKLPQEILTAERALRAAYFTSQDSPENRSAEQGADLSVCTDGTRNIYNSFQSDPLWQCCQQDYLAVQSFKAEWVSAPYTPIFHTVDALVRCTVKEPSDEAELSQTDYLLLIERGRAPGQGLWAIPGGFLEPDESRFVGALRELVEETGLAIAMSEAEACCVGHWVVDAPRRSARGRILTTLYVFDLGVRTELPPVMGADDAAKAEWVSLPSIKSGACFEDHFFLVSQAALRFGWPNTVLRSAS